MAVRSSIKSIGEDLSNDSKVAAAAFEIHMLQPSQRPGGLAKALCK